MATEDSVRAIKAANQALLKAGISGDAAAFALLLADGATYIHSNGEQDTKEDMVARIAANEYEHVERLDQDHHEIWLLGDFAVSIGTTTATHREDGSKNSLSSIDVWRRDGGQWQLALAVWTPDAAVRASQ